jgi:hypothetical protein
MSVKIEQEIINNNPVVNAAISPASEDTESNALQLAGLLQGFSADKTLESIDADSKFDASIKNLAAALDPKVPTVNFMQKAFEALSSMQSSLTDVYMSDGKLAQSTVEILNGIMKETKRILDEKQREISKHTGGGEEEGRKLSDAQNAYNNTQLTWKNFYQEAQSNSNIPTDSASRSSTNMSSFQQFLSQLMGVMTNLSQALARG